MLYPVTNEDSDNVVIIDDEDDMDDEFQDDFELEFEDAHDPYDIEYDH